MVEHGYEAGIAERPCGGIAIAFCGSRKDRSKDRLVDVTEGEARTSVNSQLKRPNLVFEVGCKVVKQPNSSILFLSAIFFAGSGCHLAFDLEAYPYQTVEQENEETGNQGAEGYSEVDLDADGDADDEDAREGPKLLISELMIRPSSPPASGVELGEYIEILNVGDEAIHPREIIIEILETNDRISIDRLISSPEEEAAVASIKAIEPGEYFVFVRTDDPFYEIVPELRPGSFYEYGRWHRSVSLSNFSRTLRLLEVEGDFGFKIHHEVGWRQGFLSDIDETSPVRLDIREDIALGLRPGVEDEEEARDPVNWCYHLNRFSGGPLVGSPGRATPQSCL